MPMLHLPTGLELCYYINRGGQRVPDLDPAKKTVVFLHALCTNASAWDLQMADKRLNQAYNLVTFDAKYHGQSHGPNVEDYSYEHYAVELGIALDMLGITSCHVVGETFAGCRPALHLTILRPELVSSLMLISPGFYKGEGPEVKEVFTELRDLFLESNLKVQSGEIDKNTKGRIVETDALNAYINYTFGQCLSEEQAEFEMDRLDRQRGRCPPEWTKEVFGMHLNMGIVEGLDRILQPVMLVRGSRNQTESPEEACDLWKAALSNSSNLEMQLVHGAPARAVTTYPFLVTRFINIWLAKNTKPTTKR